MKKLSRLLSSGAIALTTAAAASAASVNVYGLLDYGFSLSRFSGAGEQARNEWQLSEKSGMRNSSRFGLRGSENLAPNWSRLLLSRVSSWGTRVIFRQPEYCGSASPP